jgi:hypothetical protein
LSKTSGITTSSGQIVTNYTAGSISGVNDTIKASLSNGANDTVVINVTP